MPDTTTTAAACSAAAHVHSTVKPTKIFFTAGTACPKHPDRRACDCEEALATMAEADQHNTITIDFVAQFEKYLLAHEAAFLYTGDQASDHAFEKAITEEIFGDDNPAKGAATKDGPRGMTAKKFVRHFLEADDSSFRRQFTHATRKDSTLHALLTLWAARTAQWRETYFTPARARRRWLRDAYATTLLSPIHLAAHNPLRKTPYTHPLIPFPTRHHDISSMTVLPQAFRKFRLGGGEPAYELEVWVVGGGVCHEGVAACVRATAARMREAWGEVVVEVAAREFGVRRRRVGAVVLGVGDGWAKGGAVVRGRSGGGWGEEWEEGDDGEGVGHEEEEEEEGEEWEEGEDFEGLEDFDDADDDFFEDDFQGDDDAEEDEEDPAKESESGAKARRTERGVIAGVGSMHL